MSAVELAAAAGADVGFVTITLSLLKGWKAPPFFFTSMDGIFLVVSYKQKKFQTIQLK